MHDCVHLHSYVCVHAVHTVLVSAMQEYKVRTSSCRHVRISHTVNRSLCLCICIYVYILGMVRCSALWAWVVLCTMNPVSVLLGEYWLAFVCRTLQGTHTQSPHSFTASNAFFLQCVCRQTATAFPLTEPCPRHNQCHPMAPSRVLDMNVTTMLGFLRVYLFPPTSQAAEWRGLVHVSVRWLSSYQ